jgi:hypothetical protein
MIRLSRSAALSVPLIAAALVSLAACGGSGHAGGQRITPESATPTPSASTGPLTKTDAETIVSRAVLGNEDLGRKWVGKLLEGGSSLGDYTVDKLCDDATTDSDHERIARYQTDIYSDTAELSNEVVAYRAGGAAKALAEINAMAKACTGKTETDNEEDGGGTYRNTYELLPTNPSWGSDSIAIRSKYVNVDDPSDTGSYLSIFLRKGDVLSGIYEWDGNVSQELLFSVADLAEKRLGETLADKPRTTASIPVPTGTPLHDPSEDDEDRSPAI